MKIYTLSEQEEWDKIVKSFEHYDVYYLSGYVKAFQIHGDGEPLLLYYSDENLKAINVVFKRDIADFEPLKVRLEKEKYYDIVTPYGYGGWLIETKDNQEFLLNKLKQDYYEWCLKNNIIDEFVRFHPIVSNYKKIDCLYNNLVHCGNTVCLDISSEEVIWENMTSKNRNMIRKAQKSNILVKNTIEPFIINPFMDIYNETMKYDNAEEYYYFPQSFYESIREDLNKNSIWFYAELNGEIIACSIFLFCNGNMHYHLSASKHELRQYAPTNLLLYEAAKWGCRNGYKRLHLGGGLGSKEDNLYKFKKSFMRGPDTEFWIGKKIFNQEIYDKLVSLRRDLPANSQYFPLYRAV